MTARRGLWQRRESAAPVATGRTIARVWVGVGFLAVATWLILGGRGLTPVTWVPGTIAPRSVYAPTPFTYQVEIQEPNGRATLKTVAVQQDELIVTKGQRMTLEQAAALKALATRREGALRWTETWALAVLAMILSGVGYLAIRFVAPAVEASTNRLTLMAVLGLAALGVAYSLLHGFSLPVWATPMPGFAMLATLLLNPAVAAVMTLITSLLIGLMAGQRLAVALPLILGGIVSVAVVRGARRRSHLFKAGAWGGVVQGLAVIAALLIEHASWPEAAGQGGLVGAGSLIASFVLTMALLPILEHLFGVITDISLLELSDLNHPLLKELSLKAPGTYHHSLIVATLAEAGCEAIGANGLLARVGCYFHDIGKMPKADYFVENQLPGQSRHDKLSPSMSSLIIVNHVKEGIELARAHHLNPAIIEFIPGHHGTGIIYYFYRRALEQVEEEGLLKEESFRYPGPRPCRRETAVAMLADSAEAACRALPEHTPAKLTGVVRRIINNKFIDGQLNDCDLTLRDLERIAEAFVRVLTGMYHSRVPYPVPPGEDVEDEELHAGAHLQPPAPPARDRPRPAGR